ncbi:hypothetical protein BJX62DRAFT_244415 [Aspergillus germanicus]
MTIDPQHIPISVPAPSYHRPRALIACRECARRKVRCDVEQSLMPCTNCKLDCVECVVRPCKRVKGARDRCISKLVSKSSRVGGVSREPTPVCLDQPTSQLLLSPSSSDTLSWDIPAHFGGPPRHLDGTDFEYLKAKRASEIPDEELQRALLQAYLSRIHDFLPIIDLHHLLIALLCSSSSSRTPAAPVSLFLYQAVMFTSVGSVPLPCLVKAGFQSRVEARTVFAGKVKALYNVGFETDHISLLQGLLILAYWQDFSSCPKQFSHWVNWSLLQKMVPSDRCDSQQESDSQIPYRVYGQPRIPIRLYLRMYWSCFLISRVIALASHAPVTLGWPVTSDLRPGSLQLSDFDTAPLSEALLLGCGLDMDIVSAEHQKVAVQLHIATTYPGQHSTHAKGWTGKTLFNWQDSFRTILSDQLPSAASSSLPALVLRRSIPVIILHTALSSLLSQQTILLDTATSDGPDLDLHQLRNQIQDRRCLATSTVTATFIRLKAHGFLHALPPCIMALLLPATVAQFRRAIAGPDPLSRTLNEQYLTEASGVLCAMGDVTPCARRWVEVFVDMFRSHEGKLAMHYFGRQPVSGDRDHCIMIKSSLAGYVDQPGSPRYNVSKWGGRAVMRKSRRTAWKENIRVNLVAPWYVRIPILPVAVQEYLDRKGAGFAFAKDACCALRPTVPLRVPAAGRAFAIISRKEALEGYVDLGHDNHKDGQVLKGWQDTVFDTSHRIVDPNTA